MLEVYPVAFCSPPEGELFRTHVTCTLTSLGNSDSILFPIYRRGTLRRWHAPGTCSAGIGNNERESYIYVLMTADMCTGIDQGVDSLVYCRSTRTAAIRIRAKLQLSRRKRPCLFFGRRHQLLVFQTSTFLSKVRETASKLLPLSIFTGLAFCVLLSCYRWQQKLLICRFMATCIIVCCVDTRQ